MSQAAVRKWVWRLEDWVGSELFVRGHRRLTPTPAGLALAELVNMVLEYLHASLMDIKSVASSRERIATNNAVAVFWLLPNS